MSQKLWEPEQGWANHEIVMILSTFNQTLILFIMTSIRNHKNSFILVCKSINVSLNKSNCKQVYCVNQETFRKVWNETYEGCWKQQTISWKSADCCKKFPFYSSTFSNISQKSLDAWLQLGRSLLCFSGRGDDDVTWDGHPVTRDPAWLCVSERV